MKNFINGVLSTFIVLLNFFPAFAEWELYQEITLDCRINVLANDQDTILAGTGYNITSLKLSNGEYKITKVLPQNSGVLSIINMETPGLFACSLGDGTVEIWNNDSLQQTITIPFRKNILPEAWDSQPGERIRTKSQTFHNVIHDLAPEPNSRRCYTKNGLLMASGDNTIRIYSHREKWLEKDNLNNDCVTYFATQVKPLGTDSFISASSCGSIHIWELDHNTKWQITQTLSQCYRCSNTVERLDVSKDGSVLVASYSYSQHDDAQVVIWKKKNETWTKDQVIKNAGLAQFFEYDNHLSIICSKNDNHQLQIYSSTDGGPFETTQVIDSINGWITDIKVLFANSSKKFFAASNSKKILIWKEQSSEEL